MSCKDFSENDIKLLTLKEDEYDILLGEEAYREYVESGEKSRPIEELWKELDL